MIAWSFRTSKIITTLSLTMIFYISNAKFFFISLESLLLFIHCVCKPFFHIFQTATKIPFLKKILVFLHRKKEEKSAKFYKVIIITYERRLVLYTNYFMQSNVHFEHIQKSKKKSKRILTGIQFHKFRNNRNMSSQFIRKSSIFCFFFIFILL